MTPEHWQRLERIYHAVLDRPVEHRASFLDAACGDDRALRVEVESLLAYDRRASGYLSMPAAVPSSSGHTDQSSDAAVRVRAALVHDSARLEAGDLHGLLVRRLRVASAILTGALAALLVMFLWDLSSASRAGEIDELGGFGFVLFSLITHGVPLVLSAMAFVLLAWWPPVSVRALRAIELVLVGTVAAVILWQMAYPEWYSLLEITSPQQSPRNVRAFRGAYVDSTALRWLVLLVGYGSLVPNTWRRCAAVLAVLALAPLVFFAALSVWIRPLDPEVALNTFLNLALWIGVAAALVVYTAYRIEVLRQEAAAARRLGQYVLTQRIGIGGMGEVYLAEHVLLRRPCAVKLIRPDRAGDLQQIRRFEREVRLTATLTHPNTVQIFDYGRTRDDTFYYAMEYLVGPTLQELVDTYGPLPPARVIHFLRQLCGALQEAHAIGVIHRDIKPGNVKVCERGGRHDVIKLLDFGLVLPVHRQTESDKLTRDGAITGTPAYMSPEQATGDDTLDARSDLYAVGALAYFLLTGRPPFGTSTGIAALAAHLYRTPAPPATIRAEIPADLEAIVLRCLAKKVSDRFPDAESLAAALAVCSAAGDWTPQAADAWWQSQRDATSVPPAFLTASS